MRSARVAALLVAARKQLRLSQAELAKRGRVSRRLVAELERGQRPNVSFETALKLLEAAGVTVMLRTAHGAAVEIRPREADALEREARAEQRRRTWAGAITSLHGAESDPGGGDSAATRLESVRRLSETAYGIVAAAAGTRAVGAVPAVAGTKAVSKVGSRPGPRAGARSTSRTDTKAMAKRGRRGHSAARPRPG